MSEAKRFTARVITAGNCPFCGKKITTNNPLICDECASKLDDEMRGLIESKSCCACDPDDPLMNCREVKEENNG